jgi:hypothetical protein
MAEPPPYPGAPRWVKALGIVVTVVVLLVVVRMFVGGGEHGPGRHSPSGDAGERYSASSVTEDPASPEGRRG